MHQIAFEIPAFWHGEWTSIAIHWYGILAALGFLLGLWTASKRAVNDSLLPEQILDAGPWLIIGALLGARALYVISYWHEQFAGQPWTQVFMIQQGGLVFYGGLLGAILSLMLFLGAKKVPVWKFADALAPSIALGHVFGRLGCFMNGCCYGNLSEMPWAVQFPEGHPTFPHHVHPTQIYESLLNLGLYLGLAWLYRRKKFAGQVFAVYLICYPVLRSVVEFFRGDYATHYFGWVTPAQLASLGVLPAGLALYYLLSRRPALAPA